MHTTSIPAGSVNANLADTTCMIIHDRESRKRTDLPLAVPIPERAAGTRPGRP
jgi:hypothetical protein